ncbi:MAG: DUF1361 domain-containing protein, partial [Candidatus Nomurabacteria bacterium]|nr:DUF1361 domain-containing protein [Candidatus Nomurabacteria bacterium]
MGWLLFFDICEKEVRWMTYPWSVLFNTALAFVPLGAAILFRRAMRSNIPSALLTPLLAVWLLFLPNATYMLTEVEHLPGAQSLLEGILLCALISAAQWAFCRSMTIVEKTLFPADGVKQYFIAVACLLNGYGVFLGQALRFNSWDAILKLGDVVASGLDNLSPAMVY